MKYKKIVIFYLFVFLLFRVLVKFDEIFHTLPLKQEDELCVLLKNFSQPLSNPLKHLVDYCRNTTLKIVLVLD